MNNLADKAYRDNPCKHSNSMQFYAMMAAAHSRTHHQDGRRRVVKKSIQLLNLLRAVVEVRVGFILQRTGASVSSTFIVDTDLRQALRCHTRLRDYAAARKWPWADAVHGLVKQHLLEE